MLTCSLGEPAESTRGWDGRVKVRGTLASLFLGPAWVKVTCQRAAPRPPGRRPRTPESEAKNGFCIFKGFGDKGAKAERAAGTVRGLRPRGTRRLTFTEAVVHLL